MDSLISSIKEEYLELLYELYESNQQLKTQIIADNLKVAPATVTEMLQKLEQEKYIKYKKYYGATLTDKGYRSGRRIKRRHRLLEFFLYHQLSISIGNLHETACELEHAMSKELEDAICKTSNVPQHCPDDNKKIPPCNKALLDCKTCLAIPHLESSKTSLTKKTLVNVLELPLNAKGILKFIHGDPKGITNLKKIGIVHNQIIQQKTDPDNPKKIIIFADGHVVSIDREDILRLYVEPVMKLF